MFRAIRRFSGISRVELAAITGLTSAAITQIVRRFMDAELVRETDARHRTTAGGGRARIGLSVESEKIRVLGVSVRRYDVLWGLVTLDGTLGETWQTPLDNVEDPLGHVGCTMEEVATSVEHRGIHVMGIGVGLPTYRLAWEPRHAVAKILADRLSVGAIYLGHNGSYAALAEDWFHGDDLADDWLYVFLGVGIGGAVVRRGEGALAPRIRSVEAGHVGIDSLGDSCFCGNRGCVELTAAPHVLARGARLSVRGGFEALRQIKSEDKALASRALSYGLTSIVNVLNLDTIIIGGLEPSLIEAVYAETKTLLEDHTTPNGQPLNVEISQLGEWTSAIGAAMGAMDKIGQPT